jgi:hypothetical protein
MSHTYESVLKFFGDKAQRVGGCITVHADGKNVDVGRLDNSTGVFTIYPAGAVLLEADTAQQSKKNNTKDVVPNLGLDSLK